LSVGAGCASCSLYRRKGVTPPSEDVGLTASRSTSSLAAASSLLDLASSGDAEPCGVGEWSAVWLGRADYLENGVERDWSFRDVEIRDGEVINVCLSLDSFRVEVWVWLSDVVVDRTTGIKDRIRQKTRSRRAW